MKDLRREVVTMVALPPVFGRKALIPLAVADVEPRTLLAQRTVVAKAQSDG
jgi:hypothetical protein